MPQRRGYALIVSPVPHRVSMDHFQCNDVGEGTTEYDTVSCAHCNRIFHIKHGCRPEDMGGFCRLCMKVTCPTCSGGACLPFEKSMEIMEQRDYIRRQYEMVISS